MTKWGRLLSELPFDELSNTRSELWSWVWGRSDYPEIWERRLPAVLCVGVKKYIVNTVPTVSRKGHPKHTPENKKCEDTLKKKKRRVLKCGPCLFECFVFIEPSSFSLYQYSSLAGRNRYLTPFNYLGEIWLDVTEGLIVANGQGKRADGKTPRTERNKKCLIETFATI